ncbi:MAG: MurR/RpiR family transcriptional regulator [Mycobacteriaceae bacterium]
MNDFAAGGLRAHIRSVLASLLPTERAVAELMLRRPEAVIEMSSQQVADEAGASRATVVRTSQSLGFSGYQQLRVMLARDLGTSASVAPASPVAPETAAGAVRACFDGVRDSISSMTALLDDTQLGLAVERLVTASRVLVCGNGLSAPLAQLCAQRLSALGLVADAPTDGIAQQVAGRHLGVQDTLLVISGSGANEMTMRTATAARQAGASVVVVTAFGRSPLTAAADVSLVVGMRDPTFRDELTVTTRIPQFILVEGLVAGVAHRLGSDGDTAHAETMAVVGENLTE